MRNHKLFKKNPWLAKERTRITGFSPIDLGLLFGLSMPMMLVHFYCKWVRVSFYGKFDGIIDVFEVLKSDLLFHCGYIIFVFLILNLSKTIKFKVIFFLLLQFFGIFVLLLELSAHSYYMLTGGMLNYDLLVYALKNIGKLRAIVASTNDMLVTALLSLGVFLLLFGPWLLAYFIATKIETIKKKLWFNVLPNKRWSILILSSLILILILTPPLTSKNILFTKNLVFHLAHTYYENNFSNERASLEKKWKQPVGSMLEHHLSAKKKNLVFFILESTRTDATSLYNPDLKTTPFLKKLSERSLLIEKMFSVVPHTSKSLLAIHCGIEPKATVEIEESEENGIPVKCLPELLNEIGYRTVFFQTATEHFENRRSLVANFGHSEFYPGNKLSKQNYQRTNYFGYEDKILLKPSREWHEKRMKNDPQSPFMVTYLTNTTHHDYTLPSTHRYQWFHPNRFFNKYLNAVNYVDLFLTKLIQQYKDLNLYKNTIFVFVGDHGEGFREHQIYGHSNIIYREGIHVPFMVHDPSRFQKGLRVGGRHFQPDILPTIVDLLNFKLLNSVHRGLSIFEEKKDRFVYSHCWSRNTCIGRHGKLFKYIHFFNKKPDELYVADSDPAELNNIYSTTPKKLIEEWKNKTLNWYQNNHEFYRTYKTHKLTKKAGGVSENPL